jgi:hypothetical protein
MSQATPTEPAFTIRYRDKDYACEPISRNNSIFYRVKFHNSYLYLTQAISQNGSTFWTSIPADAKLKHVVHELGKVITNHYK